MKQLTLGVVIGNRGFFPSHLCRSGREIVLGVLEKAGIRAILPDAGDTQVAGSVESLTDARVCADLFRRHADEIDGVLVTLPNFGDEKAVANALRWSGLQVPVLVHAFGDDSGRMTIKDRRDSFCGKMSVCNNLRQYGIPYSLTARHTCDPTGEHFARDLATFAATCRITSGMRNLRIGMLGARPTAFNTVRFSEKLLERSGISVETLDLSEVLGWTQKMGDADAPVKEKMDAIRAYTQTRGVPETSMVRIAKLAVAIDRWTTDRQLTATAIQCWTALEEFYGVVPCTVMSMLSNSLHASACETDIAGVVAMHVLALASGTPSALLDWNNNFGDDPDKGVVFHCSNLPKHFFASHRMDYQEIIAGSVGKENTYGTIVGRIRPGPFSFLRVSTDDLTGAISGYVGEGEVTDDPLETFGGYGVIRVPRFQELLQFICRKGYEHHVSANLSQVADAVQEALTRYIGWDIVRHA